jgi:hypothetical protein
MQIRFILLKNKMVRGDLKELTSFQLSLAILFSKKRIKELVSTRPDNPKTPAVKPGAL